MSKPIDLGKKLGANAFTISSADLKDKPHYPELHLGDVDDPRLLDLPDTGTCLIRYKIVSRTHREEKREKNRRSCSISMEVHSIDPPAASPKKKDSDGGARKAFKDYFGGR